MDKTLTKISGDLVLEISGGKEPLVVMTRDHYNKLLRRLEAYIAESFEP